MKAMNAKQKQNLSGWLDRVETWKVDPEYAVKKTKAVVSLWWNKTFGNVEWVPYCDVLDLFGSENLDRLKRLGFLTADVVYVGPGEAERVITRTWVKS